MIPLVDLKAQYAYLKEEIKSEMDKVLEETDFILGKPLAIFEESFAKFCGAKYCVGVASGTDALHLALRALGVGKGDEVITQANTFVSTVLAISYTGARPVLIDINPETFNIDADKIEEKITSRAKAIIPVHLYGRLINMNKITKLAERYNLKIVEDACQAHGAAFEGKRAGSFGIMGCFSFYPGKNLGCFGDGGAVVTSDKSLCQKLKILRNCGSPEKYCHEAIGYNSRLDTLQAAVLNVKLKYLDGWNRKRLENAKIYNQRLKGAGDITLPEIKNDNSHVFHLYGIRTNERDKLMGYLGKREIYCGIHYPVPVYSLKAYGFLGLKGKDFPVTETFSREILSLPMYPELGEAQIDEIADSIKEFYRKNGMKPETKTGGR